MASQNGAAIRRVGRTTFVPAAARIAARRR